MKEETKLQKQKLINKKKNYLKKFSKSFKHFANKANSRNVKITSKLLGKL